MDTTKEPPVILSLCPGIRGLERGIERAIGPVRVAAYVEIEAFICQNLVAEMEQGLLAPAPIFTNLKTFDPEPFRGRIHGITGGYPCQPFSMAGNRKGAEDPRHLYPYIERIIEATGPIWCFFENVEGHLGLGYATVYKSLRDMGYRVESGLYSAEEVGAPHQRNRLFIFAIKMGYPNNARGGASGLGFDLNVAQKNEKQQQPFSRVSGYGEYTSQLAHAHGIGYHDGQSEKHPTEAGQHAQCDLTTGSEDELGNTLREAGLANANRSGSREDTEPGELRADRIEQPPGYRWDAYPCERSEVTRWPARPGQPQYGWEAPRTVQFKTLPVGVRNIWRKSRKGFEKMLGKEVRQEIEHRRKTIFEPKMGMSVDGYNFREDLLRALGNSVVEQTAERAFIDLLNKHIKNETA